MQRSCPLRSTSPAAVVAAAGRAWGAVLLVGLCVSSQPAAQPAVAQGAGSVGGGTVRYVDADAAPGGDGTSWASAFRDLQDALTVAEAGDELWVAEGVYRPTTGSDRTATFALASGVALYGGFDGTETSREERDWTLHRSILSGDIGVQGDSLDNAYHVVTASGVDSAAVLDGLTVQHGQANVASAERDRGAGLYAPGGSPTVRNAHFRWNRAAVGGGLQRGGGIYVAGGSPLVEDAVFEQNVGGGAGFAASGGAPVLRRVAFRRNGGTGAVLFADGSAGLVEDGLFEQNRGQGVFIEASSPVFRRTTFRDNVVTAAGTQGAGAFIDGGAPRFEDCLFENLRTRDDLAGVGGGVYVRANIAPPQPIFVRTTFRNNTANQGGGAYVSDSPAALFLDCHFEGNRALGGGGLHIRRSAAAVIASAFVGNRAEPGTSSGFGGALDVSGSPTAGRTLIASVLFAGNGARHGGAMTLSGTGTLAADLVNVTVAGNEASETGGGLRLLNAAGVRLRNVVLWGNAAPTGPAVHVAGGAGPTVERAIIEGGCPVGATCTDVLDTDPLFLRAPSPGPDGTWGTDDDDYGSLRVHPSSPAIDGGLASLLPADVWDLDSDGDTAEPLPIDAVGSRRVWGPEVDLGAYERGPAQRSPWRAPPGQASSEVEEGLVVEVRPNPVRGAGAVVLTLPHPAEVEVTLYDVLGRVVAVLAEGRFTAGRHEVAVNAGHLPAGVYVARVEVGDAVRTVRLTLVR